MCKEGWQSRCLQVTFIRGFHNVFLNEMVCFLCLTKLQSTTKNALMLSLWSNSPCLFLMKHLQFTWLRQKFKEKPQTFQEVHPHFIQEAQRAWSKVEIPLELSTLLEQNFLRYDGRGPVPDQIHAYLSTNWNELRNLAKDDPMLMAKAHDRWFVPDPNNIGDLEKLREKALLKEFEEYKQAKKKLKVFRLETVRAGFKKAWQKRDYTTIVSVADKIPNNVPEEDPKLLMWYDQAVTRMGGE